MKNFYAAIAAILLIVAINTEGVWAGLCAGLMVMFTMLAARLDTYDAITKVNIRTRELAKRDRK